MAFQAVFAIITVALISGAVADRARFGPWLVFAGVWATLVYFPVAHWASRSTARSLRWLDHNNLLAIDFAGGTRCTSTPVPQASCSPSCSASVVAGREPMRPHNLPLAAIGAGLLWFGWFGFNAGSALSANGQPRRSS